MKAKSLMVGVAIAMSAQFANAQYWNSSNNNLLTAKNNSGSNTVYVGIGTNASSNYRLDVLGNISFGQSASSSSSGSSVIIKPADSQIPLTVLTSNRKNALKVWSNGGVTVGSTTLSPSSDGLSVTGKVSAASLYISGAANLNSTLTVKGKITCKNEIEVTAMNAGSINADGINAKDIKVELPAAADYVFEDNYNLKSLSEVESYVKENKHLPGMPSASEFAEKGMSVSEMSNKLLEKVEELTLHLIQLEKENKALKAEMELMKK